MKVITEMEFFTRVLSSRMSLENIPERTQRNKKKREKIKSRVNKERGKLLLFHFPQTISAPQSTVITLREKFDFPPGCKGVIKHLASAFLAHFYCFSGRAFIYFFKTSGVIHIFVHVFSRRQRVMNDHVNILKPDLHF